MSTVRLLLVGYQEVLQFVLTVLGTSVVEESKGAVSYGTTVWKR